MNSKVTVNENITLISLHNVSASMETIADIFEKIGEMDIDAQGIFAKIKTVLSSIFAALSGLLQ